MVLKLSPPIGTGLRLAVHLGSLMPLAWLVLSFYYGGLGGDPVEAIIHFLGKGALHLLLLTLCVSPLAKIVRGARLMQLRRPLGLWCFAYASLHFFAWLSLDLQFAWQTVGREIIERTYLLVGFAAWCVLAVLAVTSIPRLQRKLGRRWKPLHQWVYLVALLAPLHYWWAVKSGIIEPLSYFAVATILLAYRYRVLFGLVARFFKTSHSTSS